MAKFGPAGNSDTFSQLHKSSVDAPQWLRGMGLDLLEYQCGRGVTIGEQTATKIGQQAKEWGIELSVHSPYFINLSSDEEDRRRKNIGYIIKSCQAADWLGAGRVTVHCGGLSGRSRKEALGNTLVGLAQCLGAMEEQGFGHIALCMETMGRVNVLGTLEEVVAICRSDSRLLPCIDFGHLNAREQGSLHTTEDYVSRLQYMVDQLGHDRVRHFHAHFSQIEYAKGGEVRHLTFEDTQFGPFFGPRAQALVQLDLHPHIICESAGTQAEDALRMKQQYLQQLAAQ